MSGYLHRLVRTVSHPSETIHPRPGSVFAPYPSAPDPPTEWPEQAETVAAHPARSESSTISEPAETVQHPAPSDEWPSPLRPGTADEPRGIVDRARRAAPPRPTGNQARHDPVEQAVRVPGPLVTPRAQRAVPGSRRGAAVQSYEPLIHPQRSEAGAGPGAPRFPPEPGNMREASATVTAAGHPARAEREPDEIQIHIGRIEVTAVQAPAPRAPNPPDTAISLDAYLERRNRRAR